MFRRLFQVRRVRFPNLLSLLLLLHGCRPSAKLETDVNDYSLSYVRIEPGSYLMGNSSDRSRLSYEDVKPVPVTIERAFSIGTTEVTQAAYRVVMGTNPSFYQGDDLPVDSVTWVEASEFCRKVGGRLPTEAEWEYAARSGISSDRYGELDEIAWYGSNSARTTHAVKTRRSNNKGMFDVLGNVTEWTATAWDVPPPEHDPESAVTDKGWVLRGGAWDDPGRSVTLWDRARAHETDRLSTVGFRCAIEPD